MDDKTIKNLNYSEKRDIFNKVFTLGNLHEANSVNEKLILISLVSLVYLKAKEKKPAITPLNILIQITGRKQDNSAFYQFLESLSIIIEDFCYNSTSADACGLTSSTEIINKIKNILNSWLPF